MAITALVAVATVTPGAVTTIAATLPTGVVNGTLLKAVLTQDGSGNIFTPPSGWTLDRTDSITNGDRQTYAKFSRVSDGTDGTTATFASNGNATMGIVVNGWNGCDTTTGSFGAGERDFSFNSPNLVTPPTSPITLTGTTITPTSGDQIVFMGGIDTNGGNGVYSAPPSGFSTIVQVSSSPSFSSAMMTDGSAAGGATGSLTVTWNQIGNSGNFVVYLFALKSSSPPPQVPYMNYAAQPMVAQ